MSESRICPVCENEIPQHIKVMCPNCDFYIYMMDDEDAIESAKKNFTDESYKDGELSGHFIAGVLGSIIITLIKNIGFGSWDGAFFIYSLFFTIPGGFLSGYIGYRLNKPSNIFTSNRRRRINGFLRTFLISLLFSFPCSYIPFVGV